jgi:hypothetical protein
MGNVGLKVLPDGKRSLRFPICEWEFVFPRDREPNAQAFRRSVAGRPSTHVTVA